MPQSAVVLARTGQIGQWPDTAGGWVYIDHRIARVRVEKRRMLLLSLDKSFAVVCGTCATDGSGVRLWECRPCDSIGCSAPGAVDA